MTRYEVRPGFSLNIEVGGSGPPVVLLHGFTGSAQSWGPFIEIMREHMTTIAVDIVGHGRSDGPDDVAHYRMPQAAADIVQAVAMAGFGRATWLGYSMGGRTALHVASASPDGVERLVLIGGSPGLRTEAERAARRMSDEALADRIVRDGMVPFVDYWESIPLFESQRTLPAATRAAIRAGRLGCNPTGLANSLRGMGTGAQQPLFDALPDLAMPALLLAGDLDERYAAIAAEMASAMPRGRAAIIPAAGHAAHIENSGACAEAVLGFLQSNEGEAG